MFLVVMGFTLWLMICRVALSMIYRTQPTALCTLLCQTHHLDPKYYIAGNWSDFSVKNPFNSTFEIANRRDKRQKSQVVNCFVHVGFHLHSSLISSFHSSPISISQTRCVRKTRQKNLRIVNPTNLRRRLSWLGNSDPISSVFATVLWHHYLGHRRVPAISHRTFLNMGA